jgi:methylated-DNA-[protein]-cysteine S-methyltransferase
MINFSFIETMAGRIYIAEKDEKVIYISIGSNPYENMQKWIKKHFPKEEILSLDEQTQNTLLIEAGRQILDYMEGKAKIIDFPVEITGTDLQKSVWKEIAAIPFGKVKSYGELARLIGKPAASRAVGAACGANPLPLIIPCHRVIGTSGSLTGFGGGLEMKKLLLELEKR